MEQKPQPKNPQVSKPQNRRNDEPPQIFMQEMSSIPLENDRHMIEATQYLDDYYKSQNEFIKKSSKPQPPAPHDDQSLIQFIDWLLQPPRYRIFAYKPKESIPGDMNESIRRLTLPLTYRVFCAKLLEFSPKEFEGLVADLLGSLGGQVIPGSEGADGGVDLLWKTSKGEYIVQCKKWKNKVGITIVREIYGATTKSQANGAFIVTTSEFTGGAIGFTKDSSPRVGLIDGKELFNLLTQIRPSVIADIQEGRWKRNK